MDQIMLAATFAYSVYLYYRPTSESKTPPPATGQKGRVADCILLPPPGLLLPSNKRYATPYDNTNVILKISFLIKTVFSLYFFFLEIFNGLLLLGGCHAGNGETEGGRRENKPPNPDIEWRTGGGS